MRTDPVDDLHVSGQVLFQAHLVQVGLADEALAVHVDVQEDLVFAVTCRYGDLLQLTFDLSNQFGQFKVTTKQKCFLKGGEGFHCCALQIELKTVNSRKNALPTRMCGWRGRPWRWSRVLCAAESRPVCCATTGWCCLKVPPATLRQRIGFNEILHTV